jgi:hypothetical protein
LGILAQGIVGSQDQPEKSAFCHLRADSQPVVWSKLNNESVFLSDMIIERALLTIQSICARTIFFAGLDRAVGEAFCHRNIWRSQISRIVFLCNFVD